MRYIRPQLIVRNDNVSRHVVLRCSSESAVFKVALPWVLVVHVLANMHIQLIGITKPLVTWKAIGYHTRRDNKPHIGNKDAWWSCSKR
jgi:hypothetical protein